MHYVQTQTQYRVEAANIIHAYNFVQLHYFQYRRPIFRLFLLDFNMNKRRSIWYPQSVFLHCRYTLRHLEIGYDDVTSRQGQIPSPLLLVTSENGHETPAFKVDKLPRFTCFNE